MEEPQKGNQFGTFAGVFTPSILTILGVIMFLRSGFVIGQAGILHAILILVLAENHPDRRSDPWLTMPGFRRRFVLSYPQIPLGSCWQIILPRLMWSLWVSKNLRKGKAQGSFFRRQIIFLRPCPQQSWFIQAVRPTCSNSVIWKWLRKSA